ncbi:hypothetical protein Tco_1119428, partial [Tanacetum coccineum]
VIHQAGFQSLSTMVDALESFQGGLDKPIYYHYLRPMSDLDVGLLTLGHDGLSHDETFCTDDLNPPFDLNIPIEVSDEYAISEGIVIRVDGQCQIEHELVHDRVNEHIHTGLEIVAVMVDEHIDNDDPVETEYDVKFSENEGNKDDEDVIDFTTIGVSSQVPKQVMFGDDAYVLDVDDFDSESGSEGDRLCDNRGLSRLDNQSIEHDRLIGIGIVLDFVEFISFTFGDKEMILVIEKVSR